MRAFSRKVCWTAAALLFISGTGAAETRGGSADQPIDEIVVVAHKVERRFDTSKYWLMLSADY
jgi:hypothetical protein